MSLINLNDDWFWHPECQPGVFAAGDCTIVPYKQIVIAMGEGRESQLGRLRSSDPLATARGRVMVALLGEIGPRHGGAASVQ